MRATLLAATIAVLFTAPAMAEEFETIRDKGSFLTAVTGKKLTRLGIKLDVLPTGEILGNAFGKSVTGAWRWQGGYFCRDLYFDERDLGPNCQMVKRSGNTLRFISDRGAGQYADLKLR